ncbi:PH, RCC1 and FYVE domains-containing protein 1-like isoform X1 [Senna tora]|uniref:PH, RCC1 and FYVE domains-containing protein 1-like isoform X1 n=1 Tax=Senna tora TaxID=362788 RepID=A0A834X4K3_9FABA|nr:PH, RCC1 and FYVE domains-containing protein 1-like isoform X1 [Senna tora]
MGHESRCRTTLRNCCRLSFVFVGFRTFFSDGMADLAAYGNIDTALITLKKGTQLIKYSRKGKPHFCSFRLSADETTLTWVGQRGERNLNLSSVSRIIPGQRTAVFRRYLCPEKDYLSFSLLYRNEERSLDLVCKDKAEADIWFAGLKALISTGQRHRHRHRHTKSDLSDLQGSFDFIQNGQHFGTTLDYTSSTPARVSIDSVSRESLLNWASSDVGSERVNMQLRAGAGDNFRISVSSSHSCSSTGSGPDDIESLGDVYVWGELWVDGASSDGLGSQVTSKTDVLIPKPLESNVVLDVHQIASGVRHIALVTRQGELFTWGDESGGRLGHGIDKGFSRPHLVEFLAATNVEFVACGEYHTCAVSTSGDLFSWGDGTHQVGLLGHGTDVSHWIPKRVTGPLEGLQVLSVACGTWHSAVATSNGKLFTFGDGTFGVLGHGDEESVPYPKEVRSLSGLKTIKVACGVWHTAAIVEVMGQAGSHVLSRKLFTWGDGDKYRLGHGNKETYLEPTCVSALIEYNFHQIACGHTMTVGLTTSGQVFTMGGTTYGQLGNPLADGKAPILIKDKLVGEYVEEIACGEHHVAALTSRSELYTWGKGANGRLGHGDIEDRKTPTLVEGLKDKHVKNISCGSNFTSCICIHKWIPGVDQSVCSGCRQAFGFTRKRHNCYHCGLVHCHACSSKKALRAALAPTPGKPHRVCDACYVKLKSFETSSASTFSSRRATPPRRSLDSKEKIEWVETRSSRILLSPITEPVKYLEIRTNKPGNKYDSSSIVRASQVPSLLQLKDIAFPSSLSAIQNAFKPVKPSSPPRTPPANSRPSSPYTRRPSPPRSPTPGFSKSLIDSLRKTNEILNQEVSKLQKQNRTLKLRSDMQDGEIQKLQKKVEETASLAGVKFSKHQEAMEFIKSITDQLKEMTDKLPPEISESEILKTMHDQVEVFLRENAQSQISSLPPNLESDQQSKTDIPASDDDSSKPQEHKQEVNVDVAGADPSQDGGNFPQESNGSSVSTTGAAVPSQNSVYGSGPPNTSKQRREGETETIEQFAPGVYVTLIVRPCDVKEVLLISLTAIKGFHVAILYHFDDKRRFDEHQAEEWWNKNKDKVLRKYSPCPTATNSAATGSPSIPPPPAEENIEASTS